MRASRPSASLPTGSVSRSVSPLHAELFIEGFFFSDHFGRALRERLVVDLITGPVDVRADFASSLSILVISRTMICGSLIGTKTSTSPCMPIAARSVSVRHENRFRPLPAPYIESIFLEQGRDDSLATLPRSYVGKTISREYS